MSCIMLCTYLYIYASLITLITHSEDAFDEYAQLMGETDGDGDQSTCAVVQKSSMIFVITDETQLLQLLSTSTNPGNLYTMIENIVSCIFLFHNM